MHQDLEIMERMLGIIVVGLCLKIDYDLTESFLVKKCTQTANFYIEKFNFFKRYFLSMSSSK